MQQVEPDLVGGKPGALDLHAAKRPHSDTAVRVPTPRAPPVLELDQLVGSLADERLHDILIGQPVRS